MKKWRNILIMLLCAALVITGLAGCGASREKTPVALMPLDSRPCNTQYPAFLADSVNVQLSMPNENSMDRFTTDADREALWQWLENEGTKSKHLIILPIPSFAVGSSILEIVMPTPTSTKTSRA